MRECTEASDIAGCIEAAPVSWRRGQDVSKPSSWCSEAEAVQQLTNVIRKRINVCRPDSPQQAMEQDRMQDDLCSLLHVLRFADYVVMEIQTRHRRASPQRGEWLICEGLARITCLTAICSAGREVGRW